MSNIRRSRVSKIKGLTRSKSANIRILKEEELNIKQAKNVVVRLNLPVNVQYDKRFTNTWLHVLDPKGPVEPVIKLSLVHQPRAQKRILTWGDLIEQA